MGERVAKERRLRAMADAVAMYEAESGAISQAELVAQERADRRSWSASEGTLFDRAARSARSLARCLHKVAGDD